MMNTQYNEKLATMLGKARCDARLSQREMAIRMNVCEKTIKHWESLVTVPDAAQVIRWFDVLHLNILEYFLAEFIAENTLDEKLKASVLKLSDDHKQKLYELDSIYGLDVLIDLIKKEIEVLNEK